MQDRNMPKADFATAIGLTLFGSAVTVMSLRMPRFRDVGADPYSVPGIVPGLLGTVLAVLGLILLIRSVRQKGYRLGLNGRVIREYLADNSTRRFLVTLFLCVSYGVLVLRRLAYPIATGLFVIFFIFVFEFRRSESVASQKRNLFIALVEAILVSGGVTVVFRYLFLVDLP